MITLLSNLLQTQLRCVLVKELQSPSSSSSCPPLSSSPATAAVTTTVVRDHGGLPLQVANDIIVSHLLSHNYEYTLSTFQPEAGIPPNHKVQTVLLI